MRKILLVLSVAPFMAGTAMAAQPLTDNQMDGVSAGFEASPELIELVGSLTPGPPPPLVTRDNFPPTAFTPPTGQNPFQPHVVMPLNTVNPGGPCICSVP